MESNKTITGKLSTAQKRVLVAMLALSHESPKQLFSRWEIGRRTHVAGKSYPVKTMRILQKYGLIGTDNEEVVTYVESGRCRCGCDRWYLREDGFGVANRFNVKDFNRVTF